MKNYKTIHKIVSKLIDIDIVGIRMIANFLPKILIPKPRKKTIVKTLHGFEIYVNPLKDKGVERSIYYTGTYEKGTLFILENIIKKGDVFADIGANIGLMTVLASLVVKDTGKVFAFEPNPNTLALLKENLKLSNVTNVEVSNYAIGSKSETSKIYDYWDAGRGSASLIKPDVITSSYEINTISLSDFFQNYNNKITLLKFDIEGYEVEALKGADKLIKEMFPMLIIECSNHRTNKNSEESNISTIYKYIKSLNKYRLYKLKGSKKRVSKLIEINTEKEVPKDDNIFCFTEEHLKEVPNKLFKISP